MVPKSKSIAPEATEFIGIIAMCKEFGTLPYPGGLFEQDSLFIYLLSCVLAYSDERRQLDEHKASMKHKGS